MYLTKEQIEEDIRKCSNELFSCVKDTGIYIDIGCEGPDSTPCLPSTLIKKSIRSALFEPRDDYFSYTKEYYRDCSNVFISNSFITPDNVVEKITTALDGEKDIYIVDLDIDTYDFYVAEAMLSSSIRPIFLSVEINEKIPPPIKFSVLYNDKLTGNDAHFFGASISKMYELVKYDYDMIQLFFNTLLFVRRDKNPYYQDSNVYKAFKPRNDTEIYKKQYTDLNMHELVSYNQDIKHWQFFTNPNELIHDINKHFKHHFKEYEIYV